MLIQEFNPKCLVVFGSFAKGEDIENSDIDILIISNSKKELDLKTYENEFARKINLYVLNSLKNSSNEFKNSITDGIVLYGYLEVI